jgi:hypothetical protein
VPKLAAWIVGAVALALGILAFATRRPGGAETPPGPKPATRPVGGGAPASEPEEALGAAPLSPQDAHGLPALGGPVSPETAAIQERVRRLEDRLRELDARRDGLVASNRDLEKQVTEKYADLSARSMAEWRVKSWETMLGLDEAQKQGLVRLMTQWGQQDAGRPADADTWLAREADIRSLLSVEQAAKLHESVLSQSQGMWANMGRTLGGMIGAAKDEQVRLQQSLGGYWPASNALLPEAHASDWNGLLREAMSRVKPTLTPEQTARLDKLGWK